jgi:biopolymer transport protein ExbD
MAVSGPSSGGGGGVFWQINITPLTDIFLVLLIIFMITASISVESAAHVGLPLAENTSPEKRGVVVTYTVDHEIFVNSKDIPSPRPRAPTRSRSPPNGPRLKSWNALCTSRRHGALEKA